MLWTGVQYKDRPLTKAFMMYWCTRRRIIQNKLNYLLNYRKRSNITGYTSQYAVNILFIFQKKLYTITCSLMSYFFRCLHVYIYVKLQYICKYVGRTYFFQTIHHQDCDSNQRDLKIEFTVSTQLVEALLVIKKEFKLKKQNQQIILSRSQKVHTCSMI